MNRQLHSVGPEPSSEEVHQMIGNYGSLSMTCPLAAFPGFFPSRSKQHQTTVSQNITNYIKLYFASSEPALRIKVLAQVPNFLVTTRCLQIRWDVHSLQVLIASVLEFKVECC